MTSYLATARNFSPNARFTVAALLVVAPAGLYYYFFRNWDERQSQVEELAQEPTLEPLLGD